MSGFTWNLGISTNVKIKGAESAESAPTYIHRGDRGVNLTHYYLEEVERVGKPLVDWLGKPITDWVRAEELPQEKPDVEPGYRLFLVCSHIVFISVKEMATDEDYKEIHEGHAMNKRQAQREPKNFAASFACSHKFFLVPEAEVPRLTINDEWRLL